MKINNVFIKNVTDLTILRQNQYNILIYKNIVGTKWQMFARNFYHVLLPKLFQAHKKPF